MRTPDLQYFKRGWFTVPAVQLTRDNINDVFEWANSKPFIEPDQSCSGLTVFEPAGRNKASFGDWIYRTPGGDFRTRPDAEFHEFFKPVDEASSVTRPSLSEDGAGRD